MKKAFIIVLAAMLLAGCTTRTEYGACVGINDKQDSTLTYKVSVLNAFLGILFIETIFVPLVVVVDELYCPIGKEPK